MDKINMSSFTNKTKLVFKNGKPEIIKPELNGEISIQELNDETTKKIQEEILSKLSDKELKNDNYFTYKVFPYIANINMDITFEEFENLVKRPKNHFELLLEMVMSEINEMFKTGENILRINQKAQDLKNNNKALQENEALKKLQKDKELEKLLADLKLNIMNKEKKDEILDKINELREME